MKCINNSYVQELHIQNVRMVAVQRLTKYAHVQCYVQVEDRDVHTHCHMYITSRGHSEALKIEQDVKVVYVVPS